MKGVHHEKESKEKSEKDRTAISKEIRNHCFVKPFRGNNEVNCSLLLKPPYVCNGCENSSRCKQPKMLYDAAIADHEHHHNLPLLRANLKVTKDQVAAINDVFSPLIHADLSASIQAFPVCNRSLYALKKVIGGF